jgi:cellobiose phosphorylase
MKFGHFDDEAKEYVITDVNTPTPWINYLGTNGFFSLISNTMGGYSFYKDAKLRRLTRYRYNEVPTDMDGRHFYIKDGNTTWSPSFLPASTALDNYECHHGLGYSTFIGEKDGIKATLTTFVPVNGDIEITLLKLTNKTNKIKKIKVFSQIEWCLWNASDDSENFQRNLSTGEVEIEDSTIYHKTEYRERRNHYAFYSSLLPIISYDSDRLAFLGLHHGYDKPIAIENGELTNSVASGWHPIAANEVEIALNPGETKDNVYYLGYVEVDPKKKFITKNVINKEPAKELLARFDSVEKVEDALATLKTYWNNLLSTFEVQSGDPRMDRMANIWNQYQCMATFNMSRSASYYESGIGRGMGFRDSCQDLLGFVHLIPASARARILDIAAIQKEDGSTYHQYQPLTKRGNSAIGGGFNDDPLWLIAATSSYLKETGDSSILQELVPFDNVEGSEKTLEEHLKRSVDYTINHKGPHGLPLIGRADWNDCLNLNCFSLTPGESFQTTENKGSGKVAESVFIAGMFVLYGEEYAKIEDKYGSKAEASRVRKEVQAISKATIKDGWDGSWFLRAYDALGHKVGSSTCEEGKIFIEPQGFCVMAGIGHELGYGKKALQSAMKLLGNDYGLELLYPPYSVYHEELGEISSYPGGYKENGAVFNHNNPWVIIALCKENMDDDALSLYEKNCPSYEEDQSDIHSTEPYVYSQMTAGRSAKYYGQAKNSWLTGSASWNFYALSQYLLGIRPTYEGLCVDPHLPSSSFKKVEVTRKFRGNTYKINICNGTKPLKLYVDGKLIPGNVIPFVPSKDVIKVELK